MADESIRCEFKWGGKTCVIEIPKDLMENISASNELIVNYISGEVIDTIRNTEHQVAIDFNRSLNVMDRLIQIQQSHIDVTVEILDTKNALLEMADIFSSPIEKEEAADWKDIAGGEQYREREPLPLNQFAAKVTEAMQVLAETFFPDKAEIQEVKFVDDDGQDWCTPPGHEQATIACYSQFQHPLDPLHPNYSNVYHMFTRESYATANPVEIAHLLYGAAIVDIYHLRGQRPVAVIGHKENPTNADSN